MKTATITAAIIITAICLSLTAYGQASISRQEFDRLRAKVEKQTKKNKEIDLKIRKAGTQIKNAETMALIGAGSVVLGSVLLINNPTDPLAYGCIFIGGTFSLSSVLTRRNAGKTLNQ